jgi:hypothetical protein
MTRDVAQREAATRLDDALNARRLETPGLNWNTWAAKARDAGYKLSTETLRAVRRGDYPPTPEVASAIEYMAGWTAGSVRHVMAGRKPTTIEAADAAAKPERTEDPEYDDPALQAVWEIKLLDEDERRAAIMAVRVIRDQKRRTDTARSAHA